VLLIFRLTMLMRLISIGEVWIHRSAVNGDHNDLATVTIVSFFIFFQEREQK
jgi:hypothetical protein